MMSLMKTLLPYGEGKHSCLTTSLGSRVKGRRSRVTAVARQVLDDRIV